MESTSNHRIQLHLTGQVAIVTGAGRGIGKAIARSLADCGAAVILAARTESEIKAATKEIGGNCIPYQTDIADEESILRLYKFIDEKFGKLDILINNAGIGRYAPFEETKTEDLDAMLQVNVAGTFLCCREGLKRMSPQKSGAIINISSNVGFKGYVNQSAYSASKHAVVGMTRVLTTEAQANNVRVSMIHPGGVDTDLVANARPDLDRSILMKPEDIAHSVMFLLSLSPRCAIDEIYIRRFSSKPF